MIHLSFFPVTCSSTDIDLCTLRPNTVVEFCFDLTPIIPSETAVISIVPNKPGKSMHWKYIRIIPLLSNLGIIFGHRAPMCVVQAAVLRCSGGGEHMPILYILLML